MQNTITPVVRIPPDYDWEFDELNVDNLGEYHAIDADCDEAGEYTGDFSHSLCINFGKPSGHSHEAGFVRRKSQLIRGIQPDDVCEICGSGFGFGFEYDADQFCLPCFEKIRGFHVDDWGYGHECIECGNPAAYMFMVHNDAFHEHYPVTPERKEGGIVCLPCFAAKCPDFAEHLWRVSLRIEYHVVPELVRVLTPCST